ncbi:hypothetical protein IFM89_035082 [Coptis chinensis]|uniref:AP2/ERF domain-containing protein n=1 Tax=Coptis chinensis TaxID=261450 RepID=A0A835M308_9MAGN|nr:hypothetical protein IFM89_035082 [Coptis chinensis]
MAEPPAHTNVHQQEQPPKPILIPSNIPHSRQSSSSSSSIPTSENLSPKPTIMTSGKHPTYRGIRSRSGKWVSEIREPRKTTRIWLGTFPTPEMAATAYDVAALALKGTDAVLNFPESISSYPILASPSPSEIRTAATTAAASKAPKLQDKHETNKLSKYEDGSSNTKSIDESTEEFIDEEAIFDMPNLLLDMAEGMLVSLPRIDSPPSDASPSTSDGESLWSYS